MAKSFVAGKTTSNNPFDVFATQGMPEGYNFDDVSGSMTTISSNLRFNQSGFDKTSGDTLTITDSGTETRFTANQACVVNIDFSVASQSSANNHAIHLYKNTTLWTDGQTQVGSTEGCTVSSTMKLNKGEYLWFEEAGTGDLSGQINLHLVATPLQNRSMILESADSVVSNWQSFVPTASATTIANESGKWRRVGDSMELEGSFTVTTRGASNASISLPSGYNIDSSKVSTGGGTQNLLGYALHTNATDSYNANNKSPRFFYDGSDDTVLFCTNASSSDGNMAKIAWNSANFMGADGEGFIFRFTVPILGWDSIPKPLLAFPTVSQFGEPEYYNSVFQTNFWDSVASTSNFDISLIPLTGSNLVEWNDTTETRLVAKARTTLHISITSDVDDGGRVTILDSSGNSIAVDEGSAVDYCNAAISIILESGDYIYFTNTNPHSNKQGALSILAEPIFPQQNQAAIISPPIAFVEDRKASGTVGGTGSTATKYNRDLNTISGDVTEVGVSTNGTDNFTLPAGKYLIDWRCPFGPVEHVNTDLYNETDSVKIKDGEGLYNQATSGVYLWIGGSAVHTISKSTAFNIRYAMETSLNNQDLGQEMSNHLTDDPDYELYTQVKITRLR